MTTPTRNRQRSAPTADYSERVNVHYDKVHQLRIEHQRRVYRETVTHQHETGQWLHTIYTRDEAWQTTFDVQVVPLRTAEAIIDRMRARGNTA